MEQSYSCNKNTKNKKQKKKDKKKKKCNSKVNRIFCPAGVMILKLHCSLETLNLLTPVES